MIQQLSVAILCKQCHAVWSGADELGPLPNYFGCQDATRGGGQCKRSVRLRAMWLPAKYPSLELSKGSVGWRGGRRLNGFNQNAMFFKSDEQSPPAAWQKGALVD
jgi:hypothetical protein